MLALRLEVDVAVGELVALAQHELDLRAPRQVASSGEEERGSGGEGRRQEEREERERGDGGEPRRRGGAEEEEQEESGARRDSRSLTCSHSYVKSSSCSTSVQCAWKAALSATIAPHPPHLILFTRRSFFLRSASALCALAISIALAARRTPASSGRRRSGLAPASLAAGCPTSGS